jgi:hypothetical protein
VVARILASAQVQLPGPARLQILPQARVVLPVPAQSRMYRPVPARQAAAALVRRTRRAAEQ